MCLGVVAILLLNLMDVFSGDGLLDRPCMVFQRMCVLSLRSQCTSKCSFHTFVCDFVCRKLSPHLGFCVMCIDGRRYDCCSECNVVSNECNEPTSCLVQPIGTHGGEVMYVGCD